MEEDVKPTITATSKRGHERGHERILKSIFNRCSDTVSSMLRSTLNGTIRCMLKSYRNISSYKTDRQHIKLQLQLHRQHNAPVQALRSQLKVPESKSRLNIADIRSYMSLRLST